MISSENLQRTIESHKEGQKRGNGHHCLLKACLYAVEAANTFCTMKEKKVGRQRIIETKAAGTRIMTSTRWTRFKNQKNTKASI